MLTLDPSPDEVPILTSLHVHTGLGRDLLYGRAAELSSISSRAKPVVFDRLVPASRPWKPRSSCWGPCASTAALRVAALDAASPWSSTALSAPGRRCSAPCRRLGSRERLDVQRPCRAFLSRHLHRGAAAAAARPCILLFLAGRSFVSQLPAPPWPGDLLASPLVLSASQSSISSPAGLRAAPPPPQPAACGR